MSAHRPATPRRGRAIGGGGIDGAEAGREELRRTGPWLRPGRAVATSACLVALVLAGCGVAHPGLTNGAISGCFRALPAARAAVHDSHARLLGVHRLSADEVPKRLRAAPSPAIDNDTTVCAVAFHGNFAAGQVTGARPGVAGAYAVVLVNAKKLDVLTSYVGDQLPKALRGRFV